MKRPWMTNPQTPAGQPRVAAFFDLDKTVIANSSILAFSESFYRHGLISRSQVLRAAYTHFKFRLYGADHDGMEQLRAQLSSMCAGWDVDQVRRIVANTLQHHIEPAIYREAAERITAHQTRGHDVYLVSAANYDVVEPIGRLLGVTGVIATDMQVRQGRYTGQIEFYAYGPHKAHAIAELAEQRGYDLTRSHAYSDSITDVPMLSAVGHHYAVNPDAELRRYATTHGWPIATFEKPVALAESGLGPLGATTAQQRRVAFSAAAVATAMVSAYWLNRRRRAVPV